MEPKDTKNKRGRKPTVKQQQAVKLLLENKGMAVSEAMRRVGYSPATAKNPQLLRATKGWQALMDQYMPEVDVAKLHLELMAASHLHHYEFPRPPKATRKPRTRKPNTDDEDDPPEDYDVPAASSDLTVDEIKQIVEAMPGCRLTYVKTTEHSHIAYFTAPDNKVRTSALDMAFKLRGSYAAEKVEVTDPLAALSNSELVAKEQKLRAAILKKRAQPK